MTEAPLMTDLYDRFARAVDALARLGGYPYSERRQAWLDRLRVNLPELEMLDALAPEAELGYLEPPPAAPGDPLPAAQAGRGIAAARPCSVSFLHPGRCSTLGVCAVAARKRRV
jgi:aspartyl-tRNA(Asn)/glutamyl-tRNA(Gln) amidotransferase subunit A